ncbi:MAG: sugar kinase [Prochloraceae cyanobacterium]
MVKNGLFVGLATLDLIYLTTSIPEKNQKIVARDRIIAAGGPVTNAAITFRSLENRVTLLTIVGNHPISNLIRADLKNYSVSIVDLDCQREESPPVASIIVTESTGERAVIGVNTAKSQASIKQLPSNILQGIDIVLIDGHQMAVSCAIARQAKANNIPVVIDGGSWKPGFETVLPFVDYAICSADFYPPNCHNREDVLTYLQEMEIPYIAITNGEMPIECISENKRDQLEVPQIETTVDTLGAGDIFHGAFCHYILQENFKNALTAAAKIASYSCQFFGTRQWMQSK